MKKVAVVVACLLFVGGSGPLLSEPLPQDKGKPTNKVMIEKLKNAQRLLEGLALGDFNRIQFSAEELIQLSKTAEWRMIQTPRFELHNNEFRKAAEELVQKAKAKNLDGSTLSYFEVTMACVRCHQYVRDLRDARAPDIRPDIASVTVTPTHP